MAISPVRRQQNRVTNTDSIMKSLGRGLCSTGMGAGPPAMGLPYCGGRTTYMKNRESGLTPPPSPPHTHPGPWSVLSALHTTA